MWFKIVFSSGNRRGKIRSRYFFKDGGICRGIKKKIKILLCVFLNNLEKVREDIFANF